MRSVAAYLLIVLAIPCLTFCSAQKNVLSWNKEKTLNHLANIGDSTKWDTVLLNRDRSANEERIAKPFRYGAFPVPKYELLGQGTFKGVGNGGNFTGISMYGKKILYSYFLVNKNSLIEKYIKDKPNEVFFAILVLSDFVDTVNFSHAGVQIISRNNPDYIGQGFFKTKDDEIDYIAFLTAERDEYAIVNMRLFNLKNGRFILIAPQKNGTIRSMQIQTPILSDTELESYIEKITKQENVMMFLKNKNNI